MTWPYTYWTWTKLPAIVWGRSLEIADMSFPKKSLWTAPSEGNLAFSAIFFAAVALLILEPILLPIAMVRDLFLREKDVIAAEEKLERRTKRCLPVRQYDARPDWLKRP